MGSNRGRWSSPPQAAPSAGSGTAGSPGPSGVPFRAHARRAVRIPSLVIHLQAGWQHQATVENIGLGGARIAASVDWSLAQGDAVTLSFTAPTLWDPLVLGGRVAWVTGPAGTAMTGAQLGGARAAGVAFDHRATDGVFALYELIVTLGYE
jgi:PilZ domain